MRRRVLSIFSSSWTCCPSCAAAGAVVSDRWIDFNLVVFSSTSPTSLLAPRILADAMPFLVGTREQRLQQRQRQLWPLCTTGGIDLSNDGTAAYLTPGGPMIRNRGRSCRSRSFSSPAAAAAAPADGCYSGICSRLTLLAEDVYSSRPLAATAAAALPVAD